MANEQNLRPCEYKFTQEDAKKGQKRSAEVRRERKLWKEEICKRLNAEDFNEIIDKLIERAKKNDKSFEILRDTMRTEA